MKQLRDDIALIAGNNELNVQMTPLAPPFTGFSLKPVNFPNGTSFWRPSMFTSLWLIPGKTYFHYNPAPGLVELMIDCRTFEGEDAGPGEIWCSCNLRDGHNYILNLAICELSENPSPPSWPSPNKPRIVSYQTPETIDRLESFAVSATWYLPMPWITSAGQAVSEPYYSMSLELDSGTLYSAEAQSIHCNPWNGRTVYISGSGEYTVSYQASRLGTSLPTGTYNIRARVFASRQWGCDVDNDPEFGPPQERYDLGIVGQVRVV